MGLCSSVHQADVPITEYVMLSLNYDRKCHKKWTNEWRHELLKSEVNQEGCNLEKIHSLKLTRKSYLNGAIGPALNIQVYVTENFR